MIETVTLTVDGRDYAGWTAVEVTRALEAKACAFAVELTERWPGQDVPRPITPGAACAVAVGGQALIEGFVDAVEPSYDATSHGVRVSGRDSAGDLVDCSAEPGEWHGQPLSQLVSAIGAPFGLRVSAETSLDAPFERFRIQEGETAWAAIERACQMRGVLCLSDGLGW